MTSQTDQSSDRSDADLDSAIFKISLRILPLLGLGYLFAFVDRVNIGFAALQMNADLGFSATVYGLGGGLFFLSYAMFEVPSTMLLERFGARRWLARIMITWGIISAGMMFITTPMQFYVMRFLLGMAEAGFFPGVIYFLSSWFPSRYRGRAISRFYISGSLASMVMGVFSAWLISFDGAAGLRGWQWLFLGQGVPTVLVGLMLLAFLPRSLADVPWLTAAEKALVEREIDLDRANFADPHSVGLLTVLCHPAVIRLGAFGFLTSGSYIALTLSAPKLLAETAALSTGRIGLLVTIGGALGALGILVAGAVSDRRRERYSTMLIATGLFLAGFVGIALGIGTSVNLVIIAYLVVALAWSSVSTSGVMLWSELLHPRLLAAGSAAINSIGQLGAFVIPLAWGALRDRTQDYRVGLVMVGCLISVAWAIGAAMALRRTQLPSIR